MTNQNKMGREVSHHPIGGLGLMYPIISAASFLSAAFLIYFTEIQENSSEDIFLFAMRIFASILLLIGIVVIYRWQKYRESSFSIFENGLFFKDRKTSRFHEWREISWVTTRSVITNGLLRRTWVKIRFSNGGTMTVSDHYKDAFQFGNSISTKIMNDRLPEAVNRIKNGDILEFGALNAGIIGLSKTLRNLAWSDVEGVKIEAGYITIRKNGAYLPWDRSYTFQIRNLHLFLGLLKHFSNIDVD